MNFVTKQITVIDEVATGLLAKKIRESLGISLRQVSRDLKCSASYICDLEKGRRNWKGKGAEKYRQWLDRPNYFGSNDETKAS